MIVLVNSQTGFCRRFLFPQCYKAKNFYFPYDVKLRLLVHSRSFLANQKARNAIVGAENLLMSNNPRDEVEGIIRQYSLSLRRIIVLV